MEKTKIETLREVLFESKYYKECPEYFHYVSNMHTIPFDRNVKDFIRNNQEYKGDLGVMRNFFILYLLKGLGYDVTVKFPDIACVNFCFLRQMSECRGIDLFSRFLNNTVGEISFMVPQTLDEVKVLMYFYSIKMPIWVVDLFSSHKDLEKTIVSLNKSLFEFKKDWSIYQEELKVFQQNFQKSLDYINVLQNQVNKNQSEIIELKNLTSSQNTKIRSLEDTMVESMKRQKVCDLEMENLKRQVSQLIGSKDQQKDDILDIPLIINPFVQQDMLPKPIPPVIPFRQPTPLNIVSPPLVLFVPMEESVYESYYKCGPLKKVCLDSRYYARNKVIPYEIYKETQMKSFSGMISLSQARQIYNLCKLSKPKSFEEFLLDDNIPLYLCHPQNSYPLVDNEAVFAFGHNFLDFLMDVKTFTEEVKAQIIFEIKFVYVFPLKDKIIMTHFRSFGLQYNYPPSLPKNSFDEAYNHIESVINKDPLQVEPNRINEEKSPEESFKWSKIPIIPSAIVGYSKKKVIGIMKSASQSGNPFPFLREIVKFGFDEWNDLLSISINSLWMPGITIYNKCWAKMDETQHVLYLIENGFTDIPADLAFTYFNMISTHTAKRCSQKTTLLTTRVAYINVTHDMKLSRDYFNPLKIGFQKPGPEQDILIKMFLTKLRMTDEFYKLIFTNSFIQLIVLAIKHKVPIPCTESTLQLAKNSSEEMRVALRQLPEFSLHL